MFLKYFHEIITWKFPHGDSGFDNCNKTLGYDSMQLYTNDTLTASSVIGIYESRIGRAMVLICPPYKRKNLE